MPLNPSDFATGFSNGRGRKLDPTKSPLAYYCVNLGWTSEALSRATGINYDTLLRYTRGNMRINPRHLAILSQVLGVDTAKLDFIPPPKTSIDYDVEVRAAWNRLISGVDPQTVLDNFNHADGMRPVVKAIVRFLAVQADSITSPLDTPSSSSPSS